MPSDSAITALRDEIEHGAGCSGKDLSGFDFEWIGGEDELVFEDCLVRDTQIKGDTLTASHWRNCKFLNCEFVGTNLRDARFDSCVFFEGATTTSSSFRFCDLERASFGKCNMSLVKVSGCQAFSLSLEDCQMRGMEFENTKFVQSAGRKHFGAARFKNCKVTDALFDKLDLTSCEFEGCDLSFSSFQGSRLVNAALRDCDLQNIEMVDANFAGADLRGSDLHGMDLPALSSHAGMMISAGQQHHLLASLGIDVSPDGC